MGHADPPAHFHKGLRTVDQIELKEMILPLVCIDVHEECAKNPDYTLTLERVKNGKQNTERFRRVRSLPCEPTGRGAGRTPRRWRTRTDKGSRIIPAGVCRR